MQGEYEQAWKHYRCALAQDPSNQVLLENIEKLKKAEQHHKNSSCIHQKQHYLGQMSMRYKISS